MKYRYVGLDAVGDEKKGFVEAESESAAVDELKGKGIYPLELSATETPNLDGITIKQDIATGISILGKRIAVTLTAFVCCFTAMIIMSIFKELPTKGVIPSEIIIALSISIAILAAVVYFHKEPALKTIINLIAMMIGFVLLVYFADSVIKPIVEWGGGSNQ